MMIFVYLFIVILFAPVIYILMTSTSAYVSYTHKKLLIRILISGIGVSYDGAEKQRTIIVGPYHHRLGKSSKKKTEKSAERKKRKSQKAKKQTTRPKLSWALRIQFIKALGLFVGRLLSSVSFDIGRVVVRPKIANPALAGMAYGWGQAFLGVFPELHRRTAFAPKFDGSDGVYEGDLTVTIKNRQICYLLYLLCKNVPIWKLVKHKYLNRGQHAK